MCFSYKNIIFLLVALSIIPINYMTFFYINKEIKYGVGQEIVFPNEIATKPRLLYHGSPN